MNVKQDQLIKLLIQNSKSAWEIEAVHNRCCIFYGLENALEKCQEIISFAQEANIDLLESFRLHIEVALLTIHS